VAGREEALDRARAARLKQDQEFKERLDEQGRLGMAGMLGTASAGMAAMGLAPSDRFTALQAERAIALNDAGAKDLDPVLRERYMNNGPYALITDDSFKRVNEYVPSGYSDFEAADLSGAGGFNELLAERTKERPTLSRQITVSPSPQPRRLSYEGLTAEDLGEAGQKGYIWANPKEPQFGYAVGNYNRGRQQTRNPAVNFLAVDLPEEARRNFMTTGEVVKDETLANERGWGQRRVEGGDVMFPKEAIAARAEVSAGDIYTKLNEMGIKPEVGDFERDPGKAFKELADTYAETVGKPTAEALQELATPVPALGTSTRKAGSLPIFQQFQVAKADPANLHRSGIGSVFLEPGAGASAVSDEQRLFMRTGDWSPTTHFEVNPALINSQHRAGDFLRRQSGAGLSVGLGLALDPSINDALQRGAYGDAALSGSASVAAGGAIEAGTKKVLAELAKRGITAPLQAAPVIAAPLAAIPLAATAERSTPMTKQQVTIDRRDNPAAYGAQGPSANQQLLRAEAARRRGSRWKIGPFALPELGISEAGGLFFR
jgi:hypothetical protein